MAVSGRLSWMLNRLRCMSPAEVGHRIGATVTARLQQRGLFLAGRVPGARLSGGGASWIALDAVVDPAPYLAAADALLRGELDVFALRPARIGHPPRWNADPRTGVEAPLVFGKTLNYRDERLVGDVKYLWEPARHLQLVTLAQAWRLSGRQSYLDGLRLQLSSWFEQCPYPLGPHWTSSLELGMRLINWSLVWHLAGGLESPLFTGQEGVALRRQWLEAVFRHQHFIAGHLSRFSSANNHLLGELAGLYVAAVTWPFWRHSEPWRRRAQALLVAEALRQNGEDGVNREQAVSYQQYVFDQLLLPALAGRAAGDEFPRPYWQRLESLLEYLASIMDVAGNLPMIGDADDASCVRLDPRPYGCRFRSSLATGAALFQRPEFARKALAEGRGPAQTHEQTRWLLGNAATEGAWMLASRPAPLPVRRAFPHGGYYLLGSRFETADEVRLLVDAGPLGYEAIAAHGHADALALTLSVGGYEFLVDPGTFAYHTQKRWRDYFRGTAAHNTVRVDGLDQSEPGGNFMWLRKAQARCETWLPGEARDEFVGSHDGYTRLPDPLVHRRHIVLDHAAGVIAVSDELACAARHQVEFAWHWSEDCQVRLMDNGSVEACNGPWRVRLKPLSSALQGELRTGQEAPIGGWISRRYDERQPTTTAVWHGAIQGNTAVGWLIEIRQGPCD